MLKELQSLALDVKVLTESGEELVIRELDDEDDAIPTARAREMQEIEDSKPEEELEITGENKVDDLDLGDINIFDNDEDEFASKEIFTGKGGDDDDFDDFGDDDIDDKFTLFDEDSGFGDDEEDEKDGGEDGKDDGEDK